MSWNFHEDDLRREIGQLREKLSVQELKIGDLKDQLVKNNEELSSTKSTLQETSDKLRKESEQALQLETSLQKRSDDLKNEKLTRENVENELRAMRDELRNQATNARETEHMLNRLAQDANGTQQQHSKLLTEKMKLEAQVRELQGELRRQQMAPPPPPTKTPRRPRASSLTDLKVASLEQDIERFRASASTMEMDLGTVKEKLSRTQNELIRVENDKAAMEKRFAERDRVVRDLMEEKSDLERELEFYRGSNGSGEHEEQLLLRLEEEEAKVTLLEQQLAKASSTKELERNLAKLRDQLANEISRREGAEFREVDLVAAREEALNELEDARVSIEELVQEVQEKDNHIKELVQDKHSLEERLEGAGDRTTSSSGFTEDKVQELLDAIDRLRAERDQLKYDFEFLQVESQFTIQSLEAKIMHSLSNSSTPLRISGSEDQLQKSQLAMSAMAVTVQHLHAKNELIDNASMQSTFELTTKDEELTQIRRRLTDVNAILQGERERRQELESEKEQLEAERDAVKGELKDVLERYDRLQDAQTLPTEDATVALTEEIKLLEGRVMRRTEQIGIHQHDIKRLETNIKLLEERLEEATADLDLADTEKEAMLEDCATAREERDAAKKALEQMEIEVERLASLLKGEEQKHADLYAEISRLETGQTNSEDVADRDERIKSLETDLQIAESTLQEVRDELTRAQSDLGQVRELSIQTVEGLKRQAESDKTDLFDQLSKRVEELDQLKEELGSLQTQHEETLSLLASQEEKSMDDENDRTRSSLGGRRSSRKVGPEDLVAVERNGDLSSQLTAAEEECQRLVQSLQEKEQTLAKNREDLTCLATKLEASEKQFNEILTSVQEKEKELEINSAEIKQLILQNEEQVSVEGELRRALQQKTERLEEIEDKVQTLERENDALLQRISTFESEKDENLLVATSLRTQLEQVRDNYESELRNLREEIDALKATNENLEEGSGERAIELEERCAETLARLDSAKIELNELRAQHEKLILEQQNTASSNEIEVNQLKEQVSQLVQDLEGMEQSLQQEIDGRKDDQVQHAQELEEALNKRDTQEAELRENLDDYRQQLSEAQTNLMSLEEENTSLQSELGNLNGECRRANLTSQHLEQQLAACEKVASDLRQELSNARESLAQAQKSGKTAEMNLLLSSQQHERTVSSLRNQLKEHEKDAERIQKLQQIVGEMKEQISEIETLLRAKTAEIEDNDDKFIQLLKEKKKLSNKVESLMKKNNNLQAKLAAASSGIVVTPTEEALPLNAARRASSPKEASSRASSHASRASSSREAVPSPVFFASTKGFEQPCTSKASGAHDTALVVDKMPTKSYIGKKRPLPDDADAGVAPVEARLADANRLPNTTPPTTSSSTMPTIPSEVTLPTATPRQRRPLQQLRTGFTPVRGQGLRPTLSQPSPLRKSATTTFSAPTAMQDVTNSPPKAKRQYIDDSRPALPQTQRPAGKGWLKKIRGDGGNVPQQRSRQQHGTEDIQ